MYLKLLVLAILWGIMSSCVFPYNTEGLPCRKEQEERDCDLQHYPHLRCIKNICVDPKEVEKACSDDEDCGIALRCIDGKCQHPAWPKDGEHTPDAAEHTPDAAEHTPDAAEHTPDAAGESELSDGQPEAGEPFPEQQPDPAQQPDHQAIPVIDRIEGDCSQQAIQYHGKFKDLQAANQIQAHNRFCAAWIFQGKNLNLLEHCTITHIDTALSLQVTFVERNNTMRTISLIPIAQQLIAGLFTLTCTLTTSATLSFGQIYVLQGKNGQDGHSCTIKGIQNNNGDQVITFDCGGQTHSVTVPKGNKGDKGDNGDKGDKGDNGEPGLTVDEQSKLKTLAAREPELSKIASLEPELSKIASLTEKKIRESVSYTESIAPHLKGTSGLITITEANLQVINGNKNKQTDIISGLGNIIIGYNTNSSSHVRSGSHNLVIGDEHSFTSYGGIVAGFKNKITAEYASVLGGSDNTASGPYSIISSGQFNQTSGKYSSISGGGGNTNISGNTAAGEYSSILGGVSNKIGWENNKPNPLLGIAASIVGGSGNIANGSYSSISGGSTNTTHGSYSSISGGSTNTTHGSYSSISGGSTNTVIGPYSSILGGEKKSMSVNNQCIPSCQ